MTTLREAAQQALEALEEAVKFWREEFEYRSCVDAADPWEETAAALKAALAEPVQEPVQDGKCKHCVDGCPACDARKLPVQEPVAWMNTEDGFCTLDSPVEGIDVMSQWAPLYAAPPRRKPLTDEEIDGLVIQRAGYGRDNFYAVARAIERAHNIKE